MKNSPLAEQYTAVTTFDRVAVDLAHEEYSELAAALRTRSNRILKRWRRLSLKAMPHLDTLPVEQFEDAVAVILSSAADAFRSADPMNLRGVMEAALVHGVDRFFQKHTPLDLFEEVRILRGAVVVELGEEMLRPLNAAEAATFHAIFDIIIQQGVIALVEKQNEQLQELQAATRDMNARLLVSATRQHELTDNAEKSKEALRKSETELAEELAVAHTLQTLSARMLQEVDVESLYDQIIQSAVAIMHSDFASMQMHYPRRGKLRLVAYRGFTDEAARAWEWVGTEHTTTCGVAYRTAQRCIVTDIEQCDWMAGTQNLLAYRQTGIRSIQSTPLISRSGGNVIGMISTHWGRQLASSEPGESALRAMDMLARQTADLLDRMQAETALRESEDRYRTLFDLEPVAIYSIDTSGVIQKFNRQAAKLWGREPALGDTDERFCGSFKMFRPDGSFMPHEQCPMAEVVTGKISEVQDGEVVIERPDLSRVTVVVNIRPLKNAAGEVTGAVNCFYDVTDRKRAEVDTARLAAIVKSSDDAIISKDLDGVITSWNEGAMRLFGYSAEEVIGKQVSLLIPQDYLDEEPETLTRIRRGEPVEHYETLRRRKDGSQVHISLTISPIKNSAGQVIGASKVARDITQRVAMERKIEQQNEALANESRGKDEFLAMLSHELRNPLAPICSAIHVLKTHERGTEDIVQKQAREIIERQVGNLTKLVNELLEVSRVVSDRIRLSLEVVDMNRVVEHAIQTVSPVIKQHKHTLKVNLSDGAWINADASRMEEVLINLLNNAAKYTPDSGRIEVHCEHKANTVVVRVRDNGIGIDRKLLPRIFGLFTQGDRSLDRAAGGLGIGLSVAQRLVSLQGGTIEVHSPPTGESIGSEFAVRLPLVPAPPVMQCTPTVLTPQSVAGVRVLVVDDNIDSVTMLTRILRDRGYSVQSAFSGPEGLEVGTQWRPDIVLLDIGLPGLDGYEVARRLRKNLGEQVRLTALTGYGRDTDIAAAREAGFNDHLVKPFDFDELEKVMALVSPHG